MMPQLPAHVSIHMSCYKLLLHILFFHVHGMKIFLLPPACSSGEFQCVSGVLSGNGTCINSSRVCDGVRDCVDGEDEENIRLLEGIGTFEGRIEYCSGGVWRTICDDAWDNRDASVVCRQLGYPSTGMYIHMSN